MATFYLDLELGNDANSGADWANAWKTFANGATAARITPGDTIRIAKSPPPVSIGLGQWTMGPIPATLSGGTMSSTNTTPIVFTKAGHGFPNGSVVQIAGHLVNTNANGVWKIGNVTANTMELIGSVGNGVGGATGTLQNINSKAVVVPAGLTATIDSCDLVWTAAAGADATVALEVSDRKEGVAALRLTLDATPQAGIKQAYKTTGTLDLSGFQEISFWLKNSAAVLATHYTITLCSDAAGATPVDTFVVPAIPSTAVWLPIVIARNGGGNLGASIQSIAVNTGSVAPTASSNILLDNFIASTTDGLNHQALITKNAAEHGGTEAYYGIQSIKDTIVLLDNLCSTTAALGKGYFGATESVTTYIRKTTKPAINANGNAIACEIKDSGSIAGGNIVFSGGWNIATDTQDGETIIDGRNGLGYGVHFYNGLAFVTVERMSACRYGFNFSTGYYASNFTATIHSSSNGSFGFHSNQFPKAYNVTVQNAVNNDNGCWVAGEDARLVVANPSGNLSSGIAVGGGAVGGVTIIFGTSYGNGYGLSTNGVAPGAVRIFDGTTNYNTYAGVLCYGGRLDLINCTINDATEIVTMSTTWGGRVQSTKHDGVVGNNWAWAAGETWNSLATDRPGADAGEQMWKCTTGSAIRGLGWPCKLTIMRLACPANEARTVMAWAKKDHATNIGVRLVCKGGQIAGVASDVYDQKADDTNWENLSITFTPTEQGAVEIEFWVYYLAGNSNAYLGKVGRS